jgi:hypothetical protein
VFHLVVRLRERLSARHSGDAAVGLVGRGGGIGTGCDDGGDRDRGN